MKRMQASDNEDAAKSMETAGEALGVEWESISAGVRRKGLCRGMIRLAGWS